MIRSFRSPFQISLLINLVVTLGVAMIAGFAAIAAIDGAVDRTLREEIRRDIALLTERTQDRDVLPPVASLTASLGQRLFEDGGGDAQSVYLLVRSDQSVIVGNATSWPSETRLEERWIETDATELGLGAGNILARVEAVDAGFFLLVEDFESWSELRQLIRNTLTDRATWMLRLLRRTLSGTEVWLAIFWVQRTHRTNVGRISSLPTAIRKV